jgi:hypothetical protein
MCMNKLVTYDKFPPKICNPVVVSLFRYFFSAFSEVEPVDWSRSGSDSSNPNVESTVGEHPLIMLWNRPPGRTVT